MPPRFRLHALHADLQILQARREDLEILRARSIRAVAHALLDRSNMRPHAIDTKARIPVGDARAAYEAWCVEIGEAALSPKRFSQEMLDRPGIKSARSDGRRLFAGLSLRSANFC